MPIHLTFHFQIPLLSLVTRTYIYILILCILTIIYNLYTSHICICMEHAVCDTHVSITMLRLLFHFHSEGMYLLLFKNKCITSKRPGTISGENPKGLFSSIIFIVGGLTSRPHFVYWAYTLICNHAIVCKHLCKVVCVKCVIVKMFGTAGLKVN